MTVAVESHFDVTVVIISYNTAELTNKTIESVIVGSAEVASEIIVVDNASYDGSPDKIKARWGDRVTLIENNQNMGFGAANNQAFSLAKGRYFFLLNSDAEVTPGSLSKMIKFADTHQNIGILGCKIISTTGCQQVSCWRTYRLSYLFFRALGLYRMIPDGWFGCTNVETYGKPDKTGQVEVVSGCTMLVRREAAVKVGFFDERFFMYCEDTDWCTRMRKGGYQVYYLAEASVIHHERGSSTNVLDKMTVEQSKSVLKFMQKEYGAFTAFVSNIFLGLFFLVRLPYWVLRFVLCIDKEGARKKLAVYTRTFCWHLFTRKKYV